MQNTFIEPILEEPRLETIHHLIHVLMEFENLVFVAPIITVLCAFFYDVVSIKQIMTIFSTKLPTYSYAQVTKCLNYTSVNVSLHSEDFKPNLNSAEYCYDCNVSTCSLFDLITP